MLPSPGYRTIDTVDSGMRIVYTCPALASSVLSWSACGKAWTKRLTFP
jgi:hypothetical protein